MDFWKQNGIFEPVKHIDKRILVIGAGSVGSFTTLTLSKMGLRNITVMDFDNVEPHNIPNQFFRMSDIGKPKVEALREIVKQFTDNDIETINGKFEKECEFFEKKGIYNIVIVAVDSMEARKNIWDEVKLKPINYFIDSRTGAESMRLYTINPCSMDDIAYYEKSLYADEEASVLPCTAQNIIYTVLGVSSFIAAHVKKVLTFNEYPRFFIFDYVSFEIFKKRKKMKVEDDDG
jgi:molybdopterin/thiamine biosynthesis adenylyltransferase